MVSIAGAQFETKAVNDMVQLKVSLQLSVEEVLPLTIASSHIHHVLMLL